MKHPAASVLKSMKAAAGLACAVLLLTRQASSAKTYGDPDTVAVGVTFQGAAKEKDGVVDSSAGSKITVSFTGKRYPVADIKGSSAAGLEKLNCSGRAELFGIVRTLGREEHKKDYFKKITYYEKSKKFKRKTFAIGPVPVFITPSVTLKVRKVTEFKTCVQADGSGSAKARFSPFEISGGAEFKVGAGAEDVVSAGAKADLTLLTGDLTMRAEFQSHGDGAGQGFFDVSGGITGPKGKVSLFGKLAGFEVEKELWKFDSDRVPIVTVARTEFSFGDPAPETLPVGSLLAMTGDYGTSGLDCEIGVGTIGRFDRILKINGPGGCEEIVGETSVNPGTFTYEKLSATTGRIEYDSHSPNGDEEAGEILIQFTGRNNATFTLSGTQTYNEGQCHASIDAGWNPWPWKNLFTFTPPDGCKE